MGAGEDKTGIMSATIWDVSSAYRTIKVSFDTGYEETAAQLADNLTHFNDVNDKIDLHLNENVSEGFYVSRDVSILGVQAVTLSNQKIPKKNNINGAVIGTPKTSIGVFNRSGSSPQLAMYMTQANTGGGASATASIVIATDSSYFSIGTIQNVRFGSFEINWTKTETGGTGTVILLVNPSFHD